MALMIRPALSFLLVSLIACSPRTVSRISPDQPVDLSGRWNDTDSRQVADKMISQLLGSDKFQEYAKGLGHKPAIVVGLIRNKTSEHIDAGTYLKKFEVAIFNSGVANLVESEEFRDKLRLERAEQQDFADPATVSRWGRETGADLVLFGEMTSTTDVYGSRRVVSYLTTLFLTDLETNMRIWYGQEEIRKDIRN
jgi:hypothetical protein